MQCGGMHQPLEWCSTDARDQVLNRDNCQECTCLLNAIVKLARCIRFCCRISSHVAEPTTLSFSSTIATSSSGFCTACSSAASVSVSTPPCLAAATLDVLNDAAGQRLRFLPGELFKVCVGVLSLAASAPAGCSVFACCKHCSAVPLDAARSAARQRSMQRIWSSRSRG